MAIFKERDWVQITPHPDERWEYWTQEHTSMAGMIGEIVEMEDAPDDPNLKFLRIVVYDDEDNPLKQEWFLEKHVILSTRYNKVLEDELHKACDELQKWEAQKKNMVNDSLKKAFGIIPLETPKKKKKKKDSTASLQVATPIEEVWDDTTDEIDQATIDEVLEILDEFEYDDIVNGTAD